jgi:hypothetical protein
LSGFSGEQIKRDVKTNFEMLERLTEREKSIKCEFDGEDGKVYSSFFSIPKIERFLVGWADMWLMEFRSFLSSFMLLMMYAPDHHPKMGQGSKRL